MTCDDAACRVQVSFLNLDILAAALVAVLSGILIYGTKARSLSTARFLIAILDA